MHFCHKGLYCLPVCLVNILFRQAGVRMFFQVATNPVAGVKLVGRVDRV